MAVNLDVLLQGPIFDFWAVPVTFIAAGVAAGTACVSRARHSQHLQHRVAGIDGSLYSDQRTILDIRESEFAVLPQQNDHVIIPLDCNNVPKGEYQIVDASSDGGGQTMLTIRKYETIM